MSVGSLVQAGPRRTEPVVLPDARIQGCTGLDDGTHGTAFEARVALLIHVMRRDLHLPFGGSCRVRSPVKC